MYEPGQVAPPRVRQGARGFRAGTVALGLLALVGGFDRAASGAGAGAPAPTSSTAMDSAENAAVVSYDQVFFAGFSAITAEDLLRRIPGIQDLLGGQRHGPGGGGFGGGGGGGGGGGNQQRGFGTTGAPILFNGRRLSGKSNDPIDALRRIQARQVVRVDVIRGSAPGLGTRVGNEGVLVNVILEDALSTSFGAWEAGVNYYSTGGFKPEGKFSYAGNFGVISYIASVSAEHERNRRVTDDTFFHPSSTQPYARLHLINEDAGPNYTATGGLAYGFENSDTANLNGRYNTEARFLNQPSFNYTITAPNVEVYTGQTDQRRDQAGNTELELGGDYEHAFANGDSVRGLFVVNWDKRPSDAFFYSTAPGAAEITTRRQVVASKLTERIARGQYNWRLAPGQSIEFGGEAALNALDQKIERFDSIASTLQPYTLFNPDAKITETRFESFTSYSNRISSKLYMEAAIDTESSRLKQRGTDVNAVRSFFFIKPRIDVRYDLSPGTQIRARALRVIGQLNFADFVSSFTFDDSRLGVILAGNPNLVPQKTWTFETTAEHRLANDQGVVSARGFYNKIQDTIDKVLIVPDVAGVGNIGNAHSYGVEIKTGLRLDRFGLPRASIDATGLVQTSSVRDAFTQDDRALVFFPSYRWSIGFRQDVNWRNLSYGVSFNGQRSVLGSDIDFRQRFKPRPDAEVFAEMRAGGLTFRLEGGGLLRTVTRDRYLYVGNRANNNLLRFEHRYDTFDKVVRFIVKGTF